MLSAPVHAQSAGSGQTCIVDEVRDIYASGRGKIIQRTDELLNPEPLDETVDFEEKGCISSYGLNGSFSLASIAQGFLNGIKDAVCSAADNYLADQIDGLASSIDAPLGLGDVGGSLVRGGEGVNIEEGENTIDFDEEQWVNDQFDQLPDVNPGYSDFDYDAGSDIGDENYLDQSRGGSRR
jgi:hypothetical protein